MDIQAFYRSAKSHSGEESLPPVHLWNPENCGDIDIRIDREGRWFHEGTRITRQPLVNLFSTILKREGEEHFLVTPQEKCRIQVDVAPLLIVGWELDHASAETQSITFISEQGARLALNAHHPLRLKHVDNEDYPVVEVRNGLEAIVARNVYYQIAEHIEEFDALYPPNHTLYGTPPSSRPFLGIRSHGHIFPLISA